MEMDKDMQDLEDLAVLKDGDSEEEVKKMQIKLPPIEEARPVIASNMETIDTNNES